MAETFRNLIYHIVFSTKNRQPLVKGDRQSRLYDYIVRECRITLRDKKSIIRENLSVTSS